MDWRWLIIILLVAAIFPLVPHILASLFKTYFWGVWGKWIPPSAFYLIIFSAITIFITTLFPYELSGLAKTIRTGAYAFLFVGLLILQLALMGIYLKRRPILDIEECKGYFFPGEIRVDKNVIVIYDALGYASCVFTGYYPKEMTAFGVTTFFIFYLLLPLVFIALLIYGMMIGVEMHEILGGGDLGRSVTKVISLIIGFYAARVLFGAFLLDFLGFGAWGVASLICTTFFVLGVKRSIDKMEKVKIDIWEARELTAKRIEREKLAMNLLEKSLKEKKRKNNIKSYLRKLIEEKTYLHDHIFLNLPEGLRDKIKEIYDTYKEESEKVREEILKLIKEGKF